MSDYYPLVEGRALVYALSDGEGSAVLQTTVRRVARAGAAVEALLEQSIQRGDDAPELFPYTVRKDAKSVTTSAWGVEFKLPLAKGLKWRRGPADFVVDALTARQVVPAGDFKGCLELSYLIGAGDGGGGRRLYAPGVGLIYASSTDETDPYEMTLRRII